MKFNKLIPRNTFNKLLENKAYAEYKKNKSPQLRGLNYFIHLDNILDMDLFPLADICW